MRRYRPRWYAEGCTCTYTPQGDKRGSGVKITCDSCKKKEFDSFQGYCRCGQVVSNLQFFKKSSPHFNGTCRHWGEPVPPRKHERTVDKPLPYPMPPLNGWARLEEEPRTPEALSAFWGVPMIGEGYPQVTWKLGGIDFTQWKNARWIETFGGTCAKCSAVIPKKSRALYRKNGQLLCAAETCGKLAERERWAR